MASGFLLVITLVTALTCCHGNTDHLVLLENLPKGFSQNATPEIVIRTNYSGLVYFKESDDFKVLLNITAPSIEKAYAVHSQMVEDNGRLLIQVYEDSPKGIPISLSLIFLVVGIATGVVALLAISYAAWWYCTKQYLNNEQDNLSHGNIMYRARNSMHLSATQADELPLAREEDHDNVHNEDTLREVPEMPEEEEAEALEMAEMKASEHHGDDGDKRVKKRYQSNAKRINKEFYRKEGARRKRHPSLNDPPSYDAVMEYPNGSSDESDEEGANRKLLPIQGSNSTIGDRTYQNVYRDGAITTFKKLDTGHIPVAHSDGDLTVGPRQISRLPRLVKGLVTPPVVSSEDFEHQGPFAGVRRFENPPPRKSSKEALTRNSREMVAREGNNESPYSRVSRKSNNESPYGRVSRQSNNESPYSHASRHGNNESPYSQVSREENKSPYCRPPRGTSPYQQSQQHEKESPYSYPYQHPRDEVDSHYRRTRDVVPRDQAASPYRRSREDNMSPYGHGRVSRQNSTASSYRSSRGDASSPLNKTPREESNISPFRVTADIHQITPLSPDSSVGHYMQLKQQLSGSPQPTHSTGDSGIYTMEKHPMDIPLTSFKVPPVVPPKPVKFTSQVPDHTENLIDLRQWEGTNDSFPPPPFPPPSDPSSPTGHSPGGQSPGGHRFSIMSDKTLSMYGSSEIFDANNHARQHDFDEEESDIDVEVPALDSDADILSDASLPLPSPPAHFKHSRPGIKFDGSPISPAARKFLYGEGTLGMISAMSPNEDWEDMRGGRLIAATASPSSTLDKHFVFPPPGHSQDSGMSDDPPPYSQSGSQEEGYYYPHADTQQVKKLLPPPPPKHHRPPQRYSWSREEGRRTSESDQNNHDPRQRHASGGRGRGGGVRAPMGPKSLHLTVLSTLCVLSLITGVYCGMLDSDIDVHITVYAPKQMLDAHQIQVWFNQHKRGDVEDTKHKIQAYDVAEPILWNMNSSLCTYNSCAQGCDENTGQCICKKGYKLDSNRQCVDVNECRERTFRCHKDAGCLNTKGSYHCICSGTFYGDGKSCEECAAACKDNMFEVQPCGNKQPKICRACTQVCYHGYYMLKQCSTSTDTECRMCFQKCPAHKFEYKQCTKVQNRECKDRSELLAPETSGNMVVENQIEVPGKDFHILPFSGRHSEGMTGFTFKRGSGFYIQVSVKHLNPTVLFEPVQHSENNDLRSFPGKQNITKYYCPYPVPAHYELFYMKHRDMKFKITKTKKMSKIEPCETYTRHGMFPDLSSARSGSVLCSGPGPLSSLFALEQQLGAHKDIWVDRSESCVSQNEDCLNCTRICTKRMLTNQGECSVREEDNGHSPRLPSCFTCCIKKDCYDLCRHFHDRGCNNVRCEKGTLIEFRLRPVYNNGEDFLCHVQPVKEQKLMELQYTIMHYHSKQITGTIVINSNDEWRSKGRTSHSEGIIDVQIDSKLGKMPNFVQGTPSTGTVKVGVYKEEGSKVKHAYIEGSSALVRPVWPFKMTTSMFGSRSCEEESLEDLVLATGSEDPYTLIQDLEGEYRSNHSYRITNKDTHPNIKIGVYKHTSILSALYPRAKLLFHTLQGTIRHNSTHWLVGVHGKIASCPGVLSMNISDPAYSSDPLFQYEFGIKCPNVFNATFFIPNGDKPYIDKDFIVTIKDHQTLYHLNIYRPSSKIVVDSPSGAMGENSDAADTTDVATPPHFSIPFIASVCGGTLLLLFIAAFGIAVKFSQPKSDVLRFRWCHLIIMCSHVTFQFVFSVCASMTVFVLIIMAVNSDNAAFLKNYQEQRSVKAAYSHLELDYMERHLQAEIARQNEIAKQSKADCENQMQKIIADYNVLKTKMEKQVKSNIDSQNLQELLKIHSREILSKFTDSMHVFNDRFEGFVKHTRQTFVADIQETYKSVEDNPWLVGATYLRRRAKTLRDLMNIETKPFMEWTGIEDTLLHASADTPIDIPKMGLSSKDFNARPQNSGPRLQRPANRYTDHKTVETHNYWLYHKHQNIQSLNSTDPARSAGGEGAVENSYLVFFVVMVFIDVVWFLHRMLKALGVSRLLLYGYPIFLDIRDKTARSRHASESEAYSKKRKKWFRSGFMNSMKEFFFKMLSSMFIPKVICTILVCLIVYVISMATIHFVNRETFSYLGYYNNVDDLLKANEVFINNRITAHGRRINMLEYPAYQQLMNLYTQRHHYVYRMAERQWLALEGAHNQLYCKYLQQIDAMAECRDPSQPEFADSQEISACHLQQIDPQLYHRHTGAESTVAEIQMDAFLESIRKMISDTCYIVLVYLSVIIVKELLGTVLWLYMKRSGFINLRIIYEADEPPPTARER